MEWHWIGCTYWLISLKEGFTPANDPNVLSAWTPSDSTLNNGFWSQYLRAYFWAIQVTTGVGNNVTPVSDTEYMFSIVAVVVGVLMYALIVDTPEGKKRRRIEAVKEYLRQRNVSEELTDQIIDYYEYCYTRHISNFDEQMLEDIHSGLQEQLQLEMNQQLLSKQFSNHFLFSTKQHRPLPKKKSKVPRFKELPDQLLLILIHSLVSRIYLPNEVVFLIGERASEMFFVVRGDLEELDPNGKRLEWHTDGSFFGDTIFKPHARRGSTIRCIIHCELLILTKAALRVNLTNFLIISLNL
ncbi:cyclic nucleotide-binding protein [Reticulomyxa filosa]|uniref:Cyclic nucleotide-binding protein n=1 Tax=Reticulomyxa filosa TaxID=46433 RepID=X6NW16_RETFI|nr:cyclic nucleotide-binding protein [Reticulomyxa filosa]|eukprot:ETO30490.1 cyclic nucleotide-binding protein [Reticulomyxa filosa]